MAFSTQRKFPGQCYEQNAVDEVNRTKSYNSIQDHRTWSMDDNQQANYLVDAIHKNADCGEGDTIDFKDRHKQLSSDEEISEEIGVNTSLELLHSNEHVFKSKIFELTLELEEIKLTKKTLEDENDDLRQRITDLILVEDEYEDVQCRFDIIEEIVLERNDLRALLDRVLGVTYKIVDLKTQLNHMERIESKYINLQEKCKEYQIELDSLREEKKIFEKRILELEVNTQETDTLKTSNMKLEKDLKELSSMISASDNFIQDQEASINSKLSTISQLQDQIENLKTSLMEAELKLNKKLRLEMDVELMEKELSIMIENSTGSVTPYNQQVIDTQVNDLAAAIKLTLGYMNCEFENDEDDNLLDTNRQLKTLLLESSNKILEFKDVINKQESNLIRVTSDFACKNDELTECLAIVDELKRQLANIETANSQNKTKTNSKVIASVTYTHDRNSYEQPENQEDILEIDMNFNDSHPNSEYESDGQEIEILENIFEKSCAQGNKSIPKGSSVSTDIHDSKQNNGVLVGMQTNLRNLRDELRQVKNDFENRREEILHSIINSLPTLEGVRKEQQNNAFNVTYTGIEKKSSELTMSDKSTNLSRKLEEMANNIEDLQQENEELKSQNRDLLSQITGTPVSQILIQKVDEMETELKELQEENHDLRLKQSNTHGQSQNHHEVLSDSPELKVKLDDLNVQNESFRISYQSLEQKLTEMAATIDNLQEANVKLETLNQNLLKQKQQSLSQQENEKFVDRFSIQRNDIKVQTSNESHLKVDLELIDVKKLQKENEKLKIANDDLVAEIGKLKSDENHSRLNIFQQKVQKLSQDENKKFADRFSIQRNDMKVQTSNESHLKVYLELTDIEIQTSNESPLTGDPESIDVKKLQNENEKLKVANDDLVAEIGKLKSAENHSRLNVFQQKVQKLSQDENEKFDDHISIQRNDMKVQTSNESHLIGDPELIDIDIQTSNESRLKCDPELIDVKKLQNENEKLKIANDDLVAKIGELKSAENRSRLSILQMKNDLEKLSVINENLFDQSSYEKLYSQSQEQAVDGIPTVVQNLLKENEDLRSANENLSVEITEVKYAENRARLDVLEKENELENLSATNESLLVQINVLKLHSTDQMEKIENETMKKGNENLSRSRKERLSTDNKDLSNVLETKNCAGTFRSRTSNLAEEFRNLQPSNTNVNKMDTHIKELQNENELLKSKNENLINEINNLKDNAFFELKKNGLDKSSSTTESLLKKESPANLHNIETDWMTIDMKNLQHKNEKLLAELTELRRKLKSIESQSHLITLGQKSDFKESSFTAANVTNQDKATDLRSKNNNSENDWTAVDMKKIQNKNEKLETVNENLLAEINELRRRLEIADKRLHLNPFESKNYVKKSGQQQLPTNVQNTKTVELKKLKNKNENSKTVAESSNLSVIQTEKHMSVRSECIIPQSNERKLENQNILTSHSLQMEHMEHMELDVKGLQKKNDELISANENLSSKIRELQNTDYTDLDALRLKNDLLSLSATNDRLLSEINELKQQPFNNRRVESDWLAENLEKLQSENDKLKISNKSLVAEISELRIKLLSTENLQKRNDPEKVLATTEYSLAQDRDQQQRLSNNDHDLESSWMATDLTKLQNKNEILKIANESLVTEIRDLKNSENRANKNIMQMERDLLKLSTINERLSAQLNDKKREKKMFSKCSDVEIDRMTVGDVKDLLKKNDELKSENENLVAEISELKAIENRAQMDALELKKLTSINSSLMAQLNKLKLTSDTDGKMESDWRTIDTKKLVKKNKKLKAANEKLTTEISELHRELKSAENRAQRFDKRASSKEVGHDAQLPDINKLQKKNDELKSANEKLLTIIVNLKNSEKLAKSKSLEFEKELNYLKETNKNLQDTLENFVEKDSNNRKPKNELERLCQLILDEGISSLTDDEFSFLSNWFSSSVSAEFELKSSRAKIVTKKHCRICQNGPLDSCRKNCECKQADDKKRLNLLKEIEETKLAIKHIQNSNDKEFDLNDVKNRLLKGKSPDPLDMERIYEIQMDDTDRSINVRTHFNKTTNDHT